MEHIDIIHTFQQEFNRLLSPMEKEIISDWKKDGHDDEAIIKALKQSVFNGAVSLRYINKILLSWKSSSNESTDSEQQDLSWLD